MIRAAEVEEGMARRLLVAVEHDGFRAALAGLPARLKQIYDPRPDKIIFIKGDPTAKYQDVIQAMDIARGAGVKVLGVTPKGAYM